MAYLPCSLIPYMAKGLVRRCTVMRVEHLSEMVSRTELQGVYLHILQVIPMIRQCCYGKRTGVAENEAAHVRLPWLFNFLAVVQAPLSLSIFFFCGKGARSPRLLISAK